VILSYSKTFIQKPIPENAELTVKQLSGFHCHGNVAFKFTRIESSGSPFLVTGLSQVPPKTADIAELKEMLQMTV